MLNQGINLHGEVANGLEVLVNFSVVGTEIANTEGHTAAKLTGWALGDDAERAAFGVTAEQGALRTAQNFNALQVKQGSVQALGTGEIDAVNINADALIAGRLV